MGQCEPRVVTSPGLGPADWWPDPREAQPDSDSTELVVLVLENGCASGTSPIGRIADPVVTYDAASVTVAIGVRRPQGDQTCPGNPAVAFTVHLTEPLGTRELLDGSHAPPRAPRPPDGWDG